MEGFFLFGLSMNVLFVVIALAVIYSGTIIGKLNGVILVTTFNGWWIE